MRFEVLRRTLALTIVFVVMVQSMGAATTTQRRRSSKSKSSAAAAAAQKAAAEAKARDQVAAEIKTLTHFMYLLGSIEKGIEVADQAGKDRRVSREALDLNERNKTKVKSSITSVRQGLEKLESDFRADPVFKKYSQYLTGVANFGTTAEILATANRFDDAGRTLLKAVDQLTDALAAMH